MDDSPDIRIGDADREQALHALGEHMSSGRLTVDEYGERSARVTAAKTRGDLAELFADLPEPRPRLGTPPAAVAQPPSNPPTPKHLAAWVDRPLNQRLVAAIVPVLWVCAVITGIATGIWWFMALPFIATAVGRGLWGQEWEQDRRGRGDRRRERRR